MLILKDERRPTVFLGNGHPIWTRHAFHKVPHWVEVLSWDYFPQLLRECLLGNERRKSFKWRDV